MKHGAGRIGSLAALVVASFLLAGTWAQAQSTKAARDAEKLAQSGQAAERALQDVVSHVQQMLGGYNGIIDGSAKNAESSYKKLAADLQDARKKLAGVNRSVEDMNQRADKYFAEWDVEIEQFNTPSVKQKSVERLGASRERQATRSESLSQAGEAFTPLLRNLEDQVLFLGRDLSPEAVADLQEEAQAVNRQADDVLGTVGVLLARARGDEAPPGTALAD